MSAVYYVLGLDVGYSASEATCGLLLGEVRDRILSTVEGPFHLQQSDVEQCARDLIEKYPVRGVAIDAPLADREVLVYRPVERAFSLGKFQKHCKPGNTGSPVGQSLHAAGMQLLNALGGGATYTSFSRINDKCATAVVEVFPTAALGVLIQRGAIPRLSRRNKSDAFFKYICDREDGRIGCIALSRALRRVTNHDERMAVVAAALAACFIEGRSSVIGEPRSGYFLMPHIDDWEMEWRNEFIKNSVRVPELRRHDPVSRVPQDTPDGEDASRLV